MTKVVENISLVWKDTSPQVLARHPEWLIDAILGPKIDPSSSTVITGFWRSGTTWILEVLARSLEAKAVFEPLMTDTTGYETVPKKYYGGTRETVEGFMPYARGSIDQPLKSHLERSLTGAVPGVFVRAARFSMREHEQRSHDRYLSDVKERISDARRKRVVAKFTRGHLVLPVLQNSFRPTVIHMRRDPRAVIESLLRKRWSRWITEMSLSEYLLTPEDGRRDVFARWTDEIHWCDRQGGLAPIAGYWILTEWYVDEFALSETIHVSFERLVTKGREYLNRALADTSIKVRPGILGSESRTSEQKKTAEDRTVGWKDRLSAGDRNMIEQVFQRFGKSELIEEV